MSETFYTSCADVLALFQAQKDNLEALLDPQAGFAPRLRQLCEQQCVLHLPESVLCSFTFQVVGHSRRGKCDARRDRGSKNGVQHMGSSPSNHAVRLKPFSSQAPHRNQLHFHLSFFLFSPAPEKPNPQSNPQPAPSYLRTPTPRPPPSLRQRWRPLARCRSSSSSASGCTILRRRRRAQTRPRGIGALRSIA